MSVELLPYVLALCLAVFGFAFLLPSTHPIANARRVAPRLKTTFLTNNRLHERHTGKWRKARATKVSREMPALLDVVTLGLAAGLSFDSSLELYCKRYDTVLSRELAHAMLCWRLGVRSRAQALEDMALDLASPALMRFSSTVTEALAFGTPLSQTLGRQAQVIRGEQRMIVEEEIEKASVKILIPLCALIVPAMLLGILGPLLGPAISLA